MLKTQTPEIMSKISNPMKSAECYLNGISTIYTLDVTRHTNFPGIKCKLTKKSTVATLNLLTQLC